MVEDPKQITDLPDEDLINNIINKQCSHSFTILSKRHSGLWWKIVPYYVSHAKLYDKVASDNIHESKDEIYYKTVLSFDKAKHVKFSTWLHRQITFHCLNSTNRNAQLKKLEQIPNPEKNRPEADNDHKVPENLIFHTDTSEEQHQNIWHKIHKYLGATIIKIFKMKYIEEMTLKEIGKELNMTGERVRQLHEAGLEMLRKKL